ncbi:MAG: aspS [Bacillales bacterium]|jgi:aspartyl-tRNA synthetase|nr:aspS [Bacillales bacterium]
MKLVNRTYFCGEVPASSVGEKITLKGWVQKRRNLGGLIFVDLRDRTGIVQVVFNPDTASAEVLESAEKIRSEFVLDVTGTVVARVGNNINPNMKTGSVEVHAESLQILNEAKTTPFYMEEVSEANEDLRLKYRYLDLRRPGMFDTFKLRSQITKAVREFLDGEGFIDVETPILTKSTPEGARDYLVPSRVHEGEFYALPQSPQLFKQMLMLAGFERYYQIARCFRDEDLRADRQPEFTQIDIETSFYTQEDIMEMTENLMAYVLKQVKGVDLQLPLPRMTYDEAMSRYGSDKPDTRFGLEFIQLSEVVAGSDFAVFTRALEAGGQVKAINVKGAAEKYSRKDIDALGALAAKYGAKGLAWVKMTADGFNGPIAKFFEGEKAEGIVTATGAEVGDLLLFVADKSDVVAASLSALRLQLGRDLGLIDDSLFNFLWVTEWPQFEYSEEDGRYYAAHHPFTMPVRADIPKLDTNPAEVKAQAYDIVLNGYELGGGSIRIFERDIQEKMFETLGFTKEEAQAQFGFLLEAFEYGTPPHGGIAFGLDRFVMLLAGTTNIRDVVAFPKTQSASCLMTDAPSPVVDAQLQELHIQLRK